MLLVCVKQERRALGKIFLSSSRRCDFCRLHRQYSRLVCTAHDLFAVQAARSDQSVSVADDALDNGHGGKLGERQHAGSRDGLERK